MLIPPDGDVPSKSSVRGLTTPESRRPLALAGAALVAVLAVVALLAGPITQDRLGASPGSTSLVSTSPGPGSSASPAIAWGPLAVFPPQDGADTARNEGTLRITDSCVVMERLGEVTLLTWPADRTSWDEASRTITFENFDGTVVTVEDGDEIVVGGSGGGSESEGEGDLSPEEYVDRIDWVAPPASSCPLESWWGVGALELETAGGGPARGSF